MERKIGEIFEYNGEWYQCVIGHCNQCSFDETGICKFIGNPYCAYRNDNKLVSFKKLEKIGGPYDDYGTILQRFKIYINVTNADTKGLELHIYSNNTVGIEIKQNKEDMEEKHSNLESTGKKLKPFDLKAAKAGKPVCTRDGRKARIICFDRDWDMHIVALVADPLGESVHYYLSNGKVDFDKQNDDDLMMLSEKKEGWVNIYHDREGNVYTDENVYNREEYAIIFCPHDKYRVATVKVEWEE